MLKRQINRIIFPDTWSNDAFVRYLTRNGVSVGDNTRFISPRHCHIDVNRGEYITIGSNCCFSCASVLAHDYSWYVLVEGTGHMTPDPGGIVSIGDNCFIGFESLILKNSTIGDNVIIGARSVVTGVKIPSNTVWAGNPARQICTLNEFLEKRKKEEREAIQTRYKILSKRKNFTMDDWGFFMIYFLERTEENYNKHIKHLEFNGVSGSKIVKDYFFANPPIWNGYDEYLFDIKSNK